MPDTKVVTGGVPHAVEYMVACDQSTIIGNGTTENPLHIGSSVRGIEVSDDGIPVAGGPFTRLNFSKATVTNAGGGEATIESDEPDPGSAFLIWGVGEVTLTNGFIQPGGAAIAQVSSDSVGIPTPIAGTIGNFTVRHNLGGTAGQTFSYHLMVNGSLTNINVTGILVGAPVTAFNAVQTLAVSARDIISVQIEVTGTPGSNTVNAVVTATLTP